MKRTPINSMTHDAALELRIIKAQAGKKKKRIYPCRFHFLPRRPPSIQSIGSKAPVKNHVFFQGCKTKQNKSVRNRYFVLIFNLNGHTGVVTSIEENTPVSHDSLGLQANDVSVRFPHNYNISNFTVGKSPFFLPNYCSY